MMQTLNRQLQLLGTDTRAFQEQDGQLAAVDSLQIMFVLVMVHGEYYLILNRLLILKVPRAKVLIDR